VYPEAGDLRGPYKKAFLTLWSLLEDSGWLLTQPGAAKDEEVPKVHQKRTWSSSVAQL